VLSEVVIDALNVTDLRNARVHNTSAPPLLDSSTAGTDSTVRIAADYDPNAYADAAMWTRYVTKGSALGCVMRYPDQFAGDYLNDDRTPKSAARRWPGGFRR
jgi:hypothetical protein